MKRLYILLTLLLAATANLAAQTDGYQPIVREGVRWICFEAIDDWDWDHQTYRIYQYEFVGDTVLYPEQFGNRFRYKRLYCKDLYRFTYYVYHDSIANLTNVQDKNNVYGGVVTHMRESNQVIYRLDNVGGATAEQFAKGRPIYDFSNRDTAMAVVLGYSPLEPMPFVGTVLIDGHLCRKYVGLHWYTKEPLTGCYAVESVGYDGYYGDLSLPNSQAAGPTGWHENFGLMCLVNHEGKILYKGQGMHAFQHLLRALSDTNGDGSVDVSDLSAAIDVSVGKAVNEKADVNGDGRVDIADINVITDAILYAEPRDIDPIYQ